VRASVPNQSVAAAKVFWFRDMKKNMQKKGKMERSTKAGHVLFLL
jgi:hypothetical protein